ncbi:MAG TPA: type II secretion system protein, partial [Campylobacterales bacterium]|nr:type II secretion system protein [Campylobacterales bacterium]
MKKAFSLIEVVFVIIILGIVASISSQIIVQVYENYITQKAIYKVSSKTELVANQIVNRLTYAIEQSTVIKTSNFKNNATHTEGVDWKKMNDINDTDNFAIVEWIGYDNDSFSAGSTPYWSGVANYETSSESILISPASNFDEVNTTILNLSNGKVDLNITTNLALPPAILFSQKDNYYKGTDEYSPKCMGLINSNNTACIFRVEENSTNRLKFDNNKPKIITERYKLAWSAYALVPEKKPNGLYNLYLRYNYQPWNGDHFYDTNTSKSLILTNMSVFKFTKNGGSIQFK